MKPRISAKTSRRLQLASFAAAILLLLAAWVVAQTMPPTELPPEEAEIAIVIGTEGGETGEAASPAPSPSEIASVALCGAAIVILLAGQAQACFFYRCPHCAGSLLWVRGRMPDFCPHCGKEIGRDDSAS